MERLTKQIKEDVRVEASGYREFNEDMYSIKMCIVSPPINNPGDHALLDGWYKKGQEKHAQVTAYLIDDEETLLFDTLPPFFDEYILEAIDDVLDGRPLDYLVLSHPEGTHAGNTEQILKKYPDATLVAPERGSHHDLFGLDNEVWYVGQGDTIDLGTHTIEFVEEMFQDHAMTIWMFERKTGTLFSVDFFGFEHLEEECLKVTGELDQKPTDAQLQRFQGYVFTWFRFVDPDRIEEELDGLIRKYSPSMIAPAHGHVVNEEPNTFIEGMKPVIRNIAELESEDPKVHTHQMMRYTQ